jgi:hypothetical protein
LVLGGTMFDDFSYAFQIWRLERQKNRLRRRYGAEISSARARKARQDEIEQIMILEMHEVDEVLDGISFCHSVYLRLQAERLDIPVPQFVAGGGLGSENWTQSEFTGKYRLSDHARHVLREKIALAMKEQREKWTWWIPIIFGLIGSLTGFLSVMRSGH